MTIKIQEKSSDVGVHPLCGTVPVFALVNRFMLALTHAGGALLLLLLLGVTPAWAQPPIVNEVAKLLANDGAADNRFGYSIDVDGDTAVIGAPYGTSASGWSAGAAYVFTRDSSGAWTQQAKLLASDRQAGDWFGVSVAISGNTVVIGALFESNEKGYLAGSAYIFTRDSSGVWTQQAKLLALDGASGDVFGNAVALDGDTAVIGAYDKYYSGSYYYVGSAYVFIRDTSGAWIQQAKLLPNDIDQYRYFGNSVAIAGDTALIGREKDYADRGNDTGSVYVFIRDSSGSWTQQAKLLATDRNSGDRFGSSVAINGDTLVIGADNDDDNDYSGSAYVFTRESSGFWTQQTKLLPSDGAWAEGFGNSVDVAGNTALIGAYGDNSYTGSAYVFTRESSGFWTQQTKLLASDGAAFDYFGFSVALNGDTALIGAPYDDNALGMVNTGSAYVFPGEQASLSCQAFEPPMNNGPVTVKKNKVLPLKATLLDNSVPVTNLNLIAPPVIQVLFEGTEGGDPIDVTAQALPAGQGTEGNQFKFDGTWWHFNLKTQNYTAPGTYTVSMISGDATEYVVNPTCTAQFVIE